MADVKAVTRIEAILNGEDITPVTREEAILSGADVEPLSREEYFVQKRLGEGGGGLEYVIPEQTVTLESSESLVTIEENGLDDIQVGESIILKIEMSGSTSYLGLACTQEGSIEISGPGLISAGVYKEDSSWNFKLEVRMAQYPITATIAAIKGF